MAPSNLHAHPTHFAFTAHFTRPRASPPTIVRMDEDAVRLAIVLRLGWIRMQQATFERQERQSQIELVTGESRYSWGRRYLLDVIEGDGPAGVFRTSNTSMELRVRSGDGRDRRDAVLQRWYRQQLREQLVLLRAKWEPKTVETVGELRIKKMKTKWGSCNAAAKRIWLNLELAKKPVACLKFILVHETVHFVERLHTDRFRELMDGLLPSWPSWRLCRDELNRVPLAHEEWTY